MGFHNILAERDSLNLFQTMNNLVALSLMFDYLLMIVVILTFFLFLIVYLCMLKLLILHCFNLTQYVVQLMLLKVGWIA